MNISIIHNSTEIVSKVLNYTRTLDICSGIGTLEMVAQFENDINLDPWDLILVYEDGTKIGEFYVSMFDKSHDSGQKGISCQDGSKLLVDWFIDDSYDLTYPTYAKYWIEKFFNDAGVTYSIDASGNGAVVAENSSLGATSAYDAIQGLLQMSGWYMYFDPDGVCIVDTLSKDLSENLYTVDDTEILNLEIKKSDKDLRNRAVVWGNYSGGSWVFADRSTTTGYETSSLDKRAVVLANSTIYSSGTAASLANKLLNEFADITTEKIVTVAGFHPVTIGDLLTIDSNYFYGTGLITKLQVTSDPSQGVRTILTLDVRCPRLFAYYGFITWVYTGTEGSGVWRKRLDSATWQDYSTGLAHYNVRDLIIKNSVFACVADGNCYVNLSHYIANWQKYDQGILTDINNVQYASTKTQAVKVDIDDSNNWISIGYELTSAEQLIVGENRTWTVIIDPKRNKKAEYPISISSTGATNLNLTDVEKYAGKDLVAVTTSSGTTDPTLDSFWGKRQAKFFTASDPDSVTMTTDGSGVTYSGSDVQYAGRTTDDTDFDYIANMVHGRTSYIFSQREFTQIVWSGDTKYQIDVPLTGTTPITYPPDFLNNFSCYWLNETDRDGNTRDVEDREYYTIAMHGDGTNQKTTIVSFTPVLSGYPYELTNTRVVSTSNITLATLLTIDGVTLNINDRVLVTAQTDTTENGIYLAGMGAWTRAADSLARCATITITAGTSYTNTVWQVANESPIVLDTSPITIQRVLIPTTRVSAYSIIDVNTDWGYGTTGNLSDSNNLTIPPRMVDGVYYYFYRGKHYSSATVYNEKVNVYKYDCETNSTSNSTVYTYAGKNYSDSSATAPTSRFNSELSVLCGSGAAYTGIQYFNVDSTYDPTVPDEPVYDPNGYVTRLVVKSTRTLDSYDTDIITDPHTYGTSHGTLFDDYWYLYSSINVFYARFQGARLVNGLYYPYIKYVRSVITYYDTETQIANTWTAGVDAAQDIRLTTKYIDIVNLYDMSVVASYTPTELYGWDGNDFIYTYTGDYETGESGSYTVNRGLYTTRLSYPVYLYNSNTIRDGSTQKTNIGTLTGNSNVISLSVDDYDDSIYRYFSTGTIRVVKEDILTGAVLDTFNISTSPPSGPVLTVSQGQIFLAGNAGTNYDNDTYDIDIYKLADAILHRPTGGTAYILERNVSNTFDIIDTDAYALNLEASIDWPLISRTYGDRLATGSAQPHFRMFTTYPSYIEGSTTLLDARSTMIGGDIMTFETGNVDIEYNKYGLIMESGLMSLVDLTAVDGNTRYQVYVLSGTHLAIETSNHYFPQYLFVSSENKFMQRNPLYSTTFLDHSSGMPADYINIIRLDDKV